MVCASAACTPRVIGLIACADHGGHRVLMRATFLRSALTADPCLARWPSIARFCDPQGNQEWFCERQNARSLILTLSKTLCFKNIENLPLNKGKNMRFWIQNEPKVRPKCIGYALKRYPNTPKSRRKFYMRTAKRTLPSRIALHEEGMECFSIEAMWMFSNSLRRARPDPAGDLFTPSRVARKSPVRAQKLMTCFGKQSGGSQLLLKYHAG